MFRNKNELSRKEKNEIFLKKKGIKINYNLPAIEAEEIIILRKPKEIAQRTVVLATTNMVAFNVLTGKEAIFYLKKYCLWEYTTSKEKDFLNEPTEERRIRETWKCERIWVLMWALGIVKELGFPDKMCNLNDIPADRYPIGRDKDPNIFIDAMTTSRSKKEILDATDLYYRMNWACMDARLNEQESYKADHAVVYERLYALNWLIIYMEQEWDAITCDT